MLDLITPWLDLDSSAPILASLVTGLLIGLDREVMGKPAGLRTHALVALAATILTIAGSHQALWTMRLVEDTQIVSDPTRMAHGILTGIGFLGAGVIFRQGPSVQGLTTAASLWITAALGVVYGVGMVGLGILGAIVTLVLLVGLRILFAALPRTHSFRLVVVAGRSFEPADLHALLAQHKAQARSLAQRYDHQGSTLTLSTTFTTKHGAAADGISTALRGNLSVQSYTLRAAHDDDA